MILRATDGPATGWQGEAALTSEGGLMVDGGVYSRTDARLNGFAIVEATREERERLAGLGFELPPANAAPCDAAPPS